MSESAQPSHLRSINVTIKQNYLKNFTFILENLTVFLKECFKKLILKKSTDDKKKQEKFISMPKIKIDRNSEDFCPFCSRDYTAFILSTKGVIYNYREYDI